MERVFTEYIEQVLAQIHADAETKARIRQSLEEHVDVMIEQHGSLAYKYLAPAEEVALEFNDNLGVHQQPQIEPRPWWANRRVYRKISSRRIFNLPLYHITDGYDPETGKFEVAKGFFAVGPVALGVFAYGGVSIGICSFGGISLALLIALGGSAISLGIAVGGLAIGGVLAIGGLAVSGGLAVGGFAKGYIAIGGKAFGTYYYLTETGEGNAVEWFRQYLPYFTRYFE